MLILGIILYFITLLDVTVDSESVEKNMFQLLIKNRDNLLKFMILFIKCFFFLFSISVFTMSSRDIPPSSSKNPNPSSSLKPKPQPPKEYVDMRNDRFRENKQILRDGLKPTDRVRSHQQFGTKQKLNEINPTNKP